MANLAPKPCLAHLGYGELSSETVPVSGVDLKGGLPGLEPP